MPIIMKQPGAEKHNKMHNLKRGDTNYWLTDADNVLIKNAHNAWLGYQENPSKFNRLHWVAMYRLCKDAEIDHSYNHYSRCSQRPNMAKQLQY